MTLLRAGSIPSYAYDRGIEEMAVRDSLFGLDLVLTRTNLFKAEKVVDEAALDKYSSRATSGCSGAATTSRRPSAARPRRR